MDVSFIILTMVVLGGTGSITGTAIAAALLSYLPEYLRSLQNPDGTPLSVTGILQRSQVFRQIEIGRAHV